jgi:hypothetical protein
MFLIKIIVQNSVKTKKIKTNNNKVNKNSKKKLKIKNIL